MKTLDELACIFVLSIGACMAAVVLWKAIERLSQ